MIETAIRHFVYELAIDMFFERVSSNFPTQRVKPVIGQYYSKIEDADMREIFYDCTIIPITELSYYEDLQYSGADDVDVDVDADIDEYGDIINIDDIAFGVRYKGYEDMDDPSVSERFDEYEETYFRKDELDFLIFSK